MKKITIFMAIVFAMTCVNAQIKIEGNDWNIVPYAGILSGTAFSVDSLSVVGFTSIRLGATGEYQATKWLRFTSRAVYEVHVFHKELFNVDIRPTKSLLIRSGYMCSLATYQRPDIVSGPGQFETWTESQIPGGALGTDVRWKFKTGDIGVGIYNRNGLEYQGRMSYKKFIVSGSYNKTSSHWSTQASWTGDLVSSVLVVQDTVIANFISVQIGDFSFYNDIGFYYKNNRNKVPRWEIGALKTFSNKKCPVSGLFGLGYAYEERSIKGYLFVHIGDSRLIYTMSVFF